LRGRWFSSPCLQTSVSAFIYCLSGVLAHSHLPFLHLRTLRRSLTPDSLALPGPSSSPCPCPFHPFQTTLPCSAQIPFPTHASKNGDAQRCTCTCSFPCMSNLSHTCCRLSHSAAFSTSSAALLDKRSCKLTCT